MIHHSYSSSSYSLEYKEQGGDSIEAYNCTVFPWHMNTSFIIMIIHSALLLSIQEVTVSILKFINWNICAVLNNNRQKSLAKYLLSTSSWLSSWSSFKHLFLKYPSHHPLLRHFLNLLSTFFLLPINHV